MVYLPPGWTESQLKAATVDDLRRVPENKLHDLDVDIIDDIYAKTIVRKAQRYELQRLDREKKGLPPAPQKPIFDDTPKDDPIVQVVERAGLSDFGFMIFRTDYSSEERWEKWQEEYHKILEATFAEISGGKKIEDKFLTSLFENEVLNDVGLPQIKDMFHILKEDGDILPGLDIGMCLAVESDAMDTLLNPVPGIQPWVYAIDVSFNFDNDLNDVAVGEYPGFFPVAISALASELYPMLASGTRPRELWTPDTQIWQSAH